MAAAMSVGALLLLLSATDAFNVDTVSFVRYRGEPGSMFGFSVAEHRERGGSWVLIGAPEAQTRQPGVARGGAVYRCDVTQDDACQEIPFDVTGNNNNSLGRQIDQKSNQWFGASVRSSGETGVVLACAPRYVWFSTTKNYRRDPVGTCYVAQNLFSDFSEYSPCRTRNWGYHRQGSCQAGLGADVAKDGKRLYVGAPGSWYWQGQIYNIASTFKMPTISPDYTKVQELNMIEYESGKRLNLANGAPNRPNGEGQLFAQNPEKRPEVLATAEGPAQDDDSYLGYSVASGDFEGTGHGGVAVGMPRGARLLGKVVLYSVNLTHLQNISGEQLGAYFSYSLTVGDIDGDGLDDLIVGAPLYTDLANNEGKYETGRVYVYYQKPDIDDDGYYMRFNRFHTRDGKNSKCRFGLSVAGLGDINKDGFGDFAVGAPYDGEKERGAVYIYHGSKNGVRESYSQIIRGEELGLPLSTFGFSVSGGLDLDDNQYPDMVVGAYDSDTAVFFRSRPVVKMVEARVSYMSSTKHISLDDDQCTLRDLTRVPCVNLQACLKYNGVGVEPYLDIDIGVALDLKQQKSPRMFFLTDEGRNVINQTMRLTKGQRECKIYNVYIKPGIKDKLTALESELRYSLREGRSSASRTTRSLPPALDASVPNVQRDSLFIQNNCGLDNVCIPDLRLTVKPNKKENLLGSNERITLDVRVTNAGEDAFEANYNLQIPPGINYVKFDQIGRERDIPVHCNFVANMTVRCDVGNPLPQGKMVRFMVVLQPYYREGISRYDFVSSVNSSNPELDGTGSDNLQRDHVLITVQTNLEVTGTSSPKEVHYQMKNYSSDVIKHENEIGPQVYHLYIIHNDGPANIIEAEANIFWPSHTLSGDRLLYLLEQPETSGNVKCDFVDNVNEEGVTLDTRKKSYFEGQRGESGEIWRAGQGGGRIKATEEERRRIAQEEAESGNGYRKRVGSSAASSASSSSSVSTSGGGSASGLRSEERHSSSSSSSSTSGSSVATQTSGSRQSASSASAQSGQASVNRQSAGRQQFGNEGLAGASQSAGTTGQAGREDTRRTQAGTGSSGGVGTEKVTYEEGSYRQRGGFSETGDAHFKWSEEAGSSRSRDDEERRLEEERRRTQTVEGGYRTRGQGSGADYNQTRANEEAWKLYGSNEFRTVSFDLGQGGSSAGGSQAGGARNDLNTGRQGTSRTTTTSWGTRTSEEEAARRKYEEEIARRAGTVSKAEEEASRIRYEEELARRAESAERQYEEEVARKKYEEERRRYEEERRRYEEELARRSGGRSYEERQRWNSRVEEERRIEAERSAAAASAGGEGGRTYTSQYETNSSWDSASGGKPRVDTRWSVNDNGVVRSGSASGEQEAYQRQLLQERQRQLMEERARQEAAAGGYRRYQNSTSYSRTGYSSGERVDPDLGYVRNVQGDAPVPEGKLGSRQRSSTVNLVKTDAVGKAHERYRRHQPLIPRFVRATEGLEGTPAQGAVNFTNIRCTVGPLKAGQEASIAIRGRLWVRTLRKIGYHKEVVVSSLVTSRLTRMPHIGETRDRDGKSYEVLTEVMPQDLPIRPEVVPLWIVVLAACAGALILMLLVAALYACGFFKRNRPSESAEKQPLNRNGYHNGDEAL